MKGVIMMNSWQKILGSSLIVCGTSVGAGMLALPSVTGQVGFLPTMFVMAACWLYMFLTGLFMAEATLWMKEANPHVSTIAGFFLGVPGKWLCSFLFLFLYVSLLTSYFSGGVPYFSEMLTGSLGFPISFKQGALILAAILIGVLFWGTRVVDRLNLVLMVGLIATFFMMLFAGSQKVSVANLSYSDWSTLLTPAPILIGAFGYHNVVPSLVNYLNKDKRSIALVLIIGTLGPFLIYTAWQAVILGSLPPDSFFRSFAQGVPVVESVKELYNSESFNFLVIAFSFFAIITSLLGVALSMVDFLSDSWKVPNYGWSRFMLSLATVLLPLSISFLKPDLFVEVFGYASGFGEATLNGLFPIAVAYLGVFSFRLTPQYKLPARKLWLFTLLLCTLLIVGLEAWHILGL